MENTNPFDKYENEVEYDYIIKAKMPYKLDCGSDNQQLEALSELENNILGLLEDEDYMKQSFEEQGLGRVYGKCALGDEVKVTFGVSTKELEKPFTTQDLIDNVKEFMNVLDSNIEGVSVSGLEGETEPCTIYLQKDGDIDVEVIKQPVVENKKVVENVDKKLVTEGKLTFKKENETKSVILSDEGIMEVYEEDKLVDSIPFSKISLERECKNIIKEGYSLIETTEDDLEQVEQNIQQGIEKVDELQDLKDELIDKMDNLMNESYVDEDRVLVLYSNIGNGMEPDCYVNMSSNGYKVCDSIEDADKLTIDEANKCCDDFNYNLPKGSNWLLRSHSVLEAQDIKALNESKDIIAVYKDNEALDSLKDDLLNVITMDQLKKCLDEILEYMEIDGEYNTNCESKEELVDLFNEVIEGLDMEDEEEVAKQLIPYIAKSRINKLQKDMLTEDVRLRKLGPFPSTEYTSKPIMLENLDLTANLTPDQQIWIVGKIGELEEVQEAIALLLTMININEPIFSIEDYINEFTNTNKEVN